MPFIRFTAFKRRTYVVKTIVLLSKIIPSYSRCVKKKLLYVVIVAPSSRQLFFCFKCIKLNMRLSCNVRLVSNAKYAYLVHLYNLQSLQLPYLIYYRVSYST